MDLQCTRVYKALAAVGAQEGHHLQMDLALMKHQVCVVPKPLATVRTSERFLFFMDSPDVMVEVKFSLEAMLTVDTLERFLSRVIEFVMVLKYRLLLECHRTEVTLMGCPINMCEHVAG